MTSPHAAAVFADRPRALARPSVNGEARESTPISTTEPDVQRNGDEFTYEWPSQGIAIEVKHLREASDGIQAELEIASAVSSARLHWGRLNLVSTTARESLVNKLAKVHEAPWRTMLEQVCYETAKAFRTGEPIVMLRPAPPSVERFLVERFLPLDEPTVLFGDGGTGKSLVALALAVAISTNTPLPCGLVPHGPASAMLLDYESVHRVHAERLGGLLKGFGLTDAPGLYYRRMTRSLADDANELRAEISRRGIRFVVVDSFIPACGIEPETADSANRIYNALRSFSGVTSLIVAHVSKAAADQRNGAARPFGSVSVANLARSTWELRPSNEEQENGRATIGLFHRKVNQGRRFPPLGLCVNFDDGTGAITLRAQDLSDSPDLIARAGLAEHLKAALAGGKRTVESLAEETGSTDETVRRTLNRLKSRGVVVALPRSDGAKGNEWGLPAPVGVS